MTKPTLLITCLGLFGFGFMAVVGARMWQVRKLHSQTFVPQAPQYQFNPPAQSLTGKVIQVTNSAEKIPRDQISPVPLTQNLLIQEGEDLTTSANGTTVVKFDPDLTLTLAPQTTLAIVSTNPAHFLLQQTQAIFLEESSSVFNNFSMFTI